MLNDIVAPGIGFDIHGHDNMEIVTIPLKGVLAHKDSLGSEGTISYGEVQIMSAGSGIQHSEFNGSSAEEVNLLQIWVFPKDPNITPRYDQKQFDPEMGNNVFQLLVSPEKNDISMWINQDAYFSMGDFDSEKSIDYSVKKSGNGAYIFVIDGEILVNGEALEKRDAIGILDFEKIKLEIEQKAKILVIEVFVQ